MDDKELILQIIDDEISAIKHDVELIELQYHDGYIAFKDSKYKNRCIYELMEEGEADRTLSILRRINKRLSEYESFKTASFMDELIYFFSMFDILDKPSFIKILLDAKYKIKIFQGFTISESDYNRDTATIKKNYEEIKKYSFIETTLIIPDNKSTIVENMLMDLDYLPYNPRDKNTLDIGKVIATTFFGYKRTPQYEKILKKIYSKKELKDTSEPIAIKCVHAPKMLPPQNCGKDF
ncbi:hypothetical protein GJV85_12250 [Sulfurimonas aquatica]|uniref:Uncharacterized protein n=1 Tax=Sulfurimonas aquatica TaxID=2672570 RepID=A0A975GDL3_9BACT|nr:hypothetical protein [Sulfurimonas aquatica]QSZ42846.1 hypothetical protein GJV85_12250 [Sulfurimonas aquatica]